MAAVPAFLLLFLVFLHSGPAVTGPIGTPPTGESPFGLSKQNIKNVITLLERQIKILHQRQLLLMYDSLKKQNKSKTAHIKGLKGSFDKGNATPSSITLQANTFSYSYSKLVGTKHHKISPNIFVNAAVEHHKVKVEGTKDDIKRKTLLSDQKKYKHIGNDDGRSASTTSVTLPVTFHSTYSVSKTQIDNYSLKTSKGMSEVHVTPSSITSHDLTINSVKSKDGVMQTTVNSSVSKKMQHIFGKGERKLLPEPEHYTTTVNRKTKSTTVNRKTNHPPTVSEPWIKVTSVGKPRGQPSFSAKSNPTGHSRNQLSSTGIALTVGHMLCPAVEGLSWRPPQEMQIYLSPNEKIQASILENILQKLNEQKGPGRSGTAHPLNVAQATIVPGITPDVANKSVMHANGLEKDEGVQEEENISEVKGVLKDITIACIAITALILATIAFLLICISLFLKKTQEAITASQKKETEPQEEYAENQNNNNLVVDERSTDGEFVSENEDTVEYLKTGLTENMSSCNSPPRGIFLPAEHLQELHDYYSPSCNNTHENLSEHSRIFKTNPTCCNQRQCIEKPEDFEDKRHQEKYAAPYSKDSDNQRISSQRTSKFTEARNECAACPSNHCCYCSSRITHFSPNTSVILGVNETTNESRLFQPDGSQCACFKFLKGSTDSYSD